MPLLMGQTQSVWASLVRILPHTIGSYVRRYLLHKKKRPQYLVQVARKAQLQRKSLGLCSQRGLICAAARAGPGVLVHLGPGVARRWA